MGTGFGGELGRTLLVYLLLCVAVAFGLGLLVRGCHLPFTIEIKRPSAAVHEEGGK